jgi:hypothetical protein
MVDEAGPSAAAVRVIRDLAGLGALDGLSCCRVDLSSPRFDDASHDGVRQLVVCRIVDAPGGGFEVAQRFENGRDDRTAVGVERQELLRTYRRNKALVTVEERSHGVAGAFLGFGHDFTGDGIYALERIPIRPIYRAEIRANLAHALRLPPLSRAVPDAATQLPRTVALLASGGGRHASNRRVCAPQHASRQGGSYAWAVIYR